VIQAKIPFFSGESTSNKYQKNAPPLSQPNLMDPPMSRPEFQPDLRHCAPNYGRTVWPPISHPMSDVVMLVVAHCGPISMTCGSCSCRNHIINLVIGVSRTPVLDWNDLPPELPGQSFDFFRQSLKTYLNIFGD